MWHTHGMADAGDRGLSCEEQHQAGLEPVRQVVACLVPREINSDYNIEPCAWIIKEILHDRIIKNTLSTSKSCL